MMPEIVSDALGEHFGGEGFGDNRYRGESNGECNIKVTTMT